MCGRCSNIVFKLILTILTICFLVITPCYVLLAEEYDVKEQGYFKYVDYEDGVWIVGGYVDPPEYYDESDGTWVSDDSMEVTWTIPDTLDGKKVIGLGKLYGCDEIFYNTWEASKIVLPDTIKYISDETFEDYRVKEINLPNNLESIGSNLFNGCEYLKEISIPEKIEYIGDYAFFKCKRLQSIILPNNLKEIGQHAFDGCISIKKVKIPAGINYIEDYAFADCRSLESFSVDSGNEKYFAVDGMLCEHSTAYIEKEVAPDNEYYEDDEDDEYYEVPITYVLQYPLGKKGKLTITKDMLFEGAALMNAVGIEEFVVDADNRYYSSEEGVLFNKDKTDLKYVPCAKTGNYSIPDTVEIINFSAFSNSNLTKVIIPDSVVEVGSYAFYQCNKLESVSIGSGLEVIDFFTCENLKEISISSDNSNFISIDNVVYDKKCEKLYFCPRAYKGKLSLPESVKSISYNALVSRDLDDKYYRCDGITELYLGKSFDDAVYEFEKDAFENNLFAPYSLEKISVSENNANYKSVDGVLYSKDMKKLIMIPPAMENVVIPDGVTELLYSCCSESSIMATREDGSTYYYFVQRNKSIEFPQSVKMIPYGVRPGIIYGFSGSEAEEYAKENNIKFENIGISSKDISNQQTTGDSQQNVTPGNTNGNNMTYNNSVTVGKVNGLSVKNKKSKKISVSWKKQKGINKYQVQYALNKKFTKKKKTKTVTGSKSSVTIAKLKKGKTYYVRVRACKKSSSGMVYGKWSIAKKINIKK